MTKTLFQWYALVHYSTCESCLRRHGAIFELEGNFVPLHENCRCHILDISSYELDDCREKGDRMREKAMAELTRRRSWSEAVTSLARDFTRSEALFRQALQIDLYLEEIEALAREHGQWLTDHRQERERLSKLFTRGYRIKFNQDKYQPIAPGMKAAQEQHGIDRIRELLA